MRPEALEEILDEGEVEAVGSLDAVAPPGDEVFETGEHRLFPHHRPQHPEGPAGALVRHDAVAWPRPVDAVDRPFVVGAAAEDIALLPAAAKGLSLLLPELMMDEHQRRKLGEPLGDDVAAGPLAGRDDVAPPLVPRLVGDNVEGGVDLSLLAARGQIGHFERLGEIANVLREGDVARKALGIAGEPGELGDAEVRPGIFDEPSAVLFPRRIERPHHRRHVVLGARMKIDGRSSARRRLERSADDVEKPHRVFGLPDDATTALPDLLVHGLDAAAVHDPARRPLDRQLHVARPGGPEGGIDAGLPVVERVFLGVAPVLVVDADGVDESRHGEEARAKAREDDATGKDKLSGPPRELRPPVGKAAVEPESDADALPRRQWLRRRDDIQPAAVLDRRGRLIFLRRIDRLVVDRPVGGLLEVGADGEGDLPHR